MDDTEVFIDRLDNGLTVITEEVPTVASVSYSLSCRGGIIYDAQERIGESLILAEMLSRGANTMNAVELSDAFDNGGILHSESCSGGRFTLRGSLLNDQLELTLNLLSSMILTPHLPEQDIDSIRSLLLFDIDSLSDNPSRRALVELGARYYPAPFNRPSMGEREGLMNVNLKSIKTLWSNVFRPEGAVLSIAGNVSRKEVLVLVDKYFSSWKGRGIDPVSFGKVGELGRTHISQETAQTQIVFCYPAMKFGEPGYYAARMLIEALSGGMYGRLFTEVREKRGLCYSVWASFGATSQYGTVTAYCGTTPERAAECLEVMQGEFDRALGTISKEELFRARANVKAGLIIGEESPAARASSNGYEWWTHKRIRSIDEIMDALNRVDSSAIDDFLHTYPHSAKTIVTLGTESRII